MGRVTREAWVRHRAEKHLSAEEYLQRKRYELRQRLDDLILPYLDTCHWIRLREVVMNDPRADRRYEPVLIKLRELKAEGKLLCPFSLLVFLELKKQKSDATRRAMARLIDELSDGVCLQPPDEIGQIELRRQILRSVLGAHAPDLNELVWTKAAWVCGELLPDATAFSAEDRNTIKKVFTDVMWNSRLFDLVEFPTGTPLHAYYQDLAGKFEQDAIAYRKQGADFRRVLTDEKVHLVGGLVRNDLPRIAQEIWRQYPKECAAVDTEQDSVQKPDPSMLASVQIRAAVHASFFAASVGMKFEANDLIDAQHAAVALPYCDLLFVERPLAHRLKVQPLDFERIYKKPILSDPVQFLAWLEQL